MKERLAEYRWEKETGGIVWNGVPIRTDDRSKMLLSGIQQKIEKDADRDFFMNAEEAKRYGIVDEIVKAKNNHKG